MSLGSWAGLSRRQASSRENWCLSYLNSLEDTTNCWRKHSPSRTDSMLKLIASKRKSWRKKSTITKTFRTKFKSRSRWPRSGHWGLKKRKRTWCRLFLSKIWRRRPMTVGSKVVKMRKRSLTQCPHRKLGLERATLSLTLLKILSVLKTLISHLQSELVEKW